jgi:nicotinamide phosphoribosyltransferase
MDDFNIILACDSYKITQWRQMPPKTEKVYSYLESRGGNSSKIMFFGLQYFLKRYLAGVVVTEEKIVEARENLKLHFGDDTLFNEVGWRHILDKHNGKLPIRIKAVAEGAMIPFRNVLMTVENTDPKCFWLTNYLETLLVQVWYSCSVATLSKEIRNIILSYLNETGTPELVDFKLHDFGFRGVSSFESAGIGGLSHTVNFKGSDTMAANGFGRKYYNEPMASFSIPATEHSTITSWGIDKEEDAYRNVIKQYPNSPFVACVSDSYNIYNACSDLWGNKLKNEVINMEGTLVVRPDSGPPVITVMGVIRILDEKFGHVVNGKGYKVLNNVAIIQGDGVDKETIKDILWALRSENYSADNIAFGMGGALLQKLNRDTHSFAFKCSSITVDGVERDVFKQPIDDMAKASKAGRLALGKEFSNRYFTTSPKILEEVYGLQDQLQTVFENGLIIKEYTLEEVRNNALEL